VRRGLRETVSGGDEGCLGWYEVADMDEDVVLSWTRGTDVIACRLIRPR
jgi:hypothetical protein